MSQRHPFSTVSCFRRFDSRDKISHYFDRFICQRLYYDAIDRGFEPRSGQTKDCENGMCCFSNKHAALRRKSKDCLARNQNNVSEWSDISTRGLLFQ